MRSSPLLEFRDISFARNDWLLFERLSGVVSAGEVLQITGANGSGKTTLLRILVTLLSPSIGRLFWREQEIRGHSPDYLENLVFIGHQPGMKLALSPRENLVWLTRIQSCKPMVVDTALERMGLSSFADVPCATLSAGQLRRVALARLCLSTARLWVLDEPLTAIDSEGTAMVETLFAQHLNNGGALVVSSHQELKLPGLRQLALGDSARGSDAACG